MIPNDKADLPVPTPQHHVGPVTRSHASPYSEADRQARLAAASAEYERLAKDKAFKDRVAKGVGIDWNVIQCIEK